MAGGVDYEIDPEQAEAVRRLALSKGFNADQAEYKVREYARALGSSVKGRLYSAAEGELNKKVRLQAENIDPSYTQDPKKKAEVESMFPPGSPEGKAFARYMRGKMDSTVRPEDVAYNNASDMEAILRPAAKLTDTAANAVSLGGYSLAQRAVKHLSGGSDDKLKERPDGGGFTTRAANAWGGRPQDMVEMTPSLPPENIDGEAQGPIEWQGQEVPEPGIPGANTAVDILSSAIGAPGVIAGKAGKAFDAGTKAWKAGGRLARAGKGLVKGLSTYELTAPATAAARTAAEGGSAADAKKAAGDTATNPVGLGLSAAGGVAGELADRFATRLRDTARPAGQIIEDVRESGGGKIKAFGDEPTVGGAYENPTLRVKADGTPLEEGRRGVNRVSGYAGRKFTSVNRALVRQARMRQSEVLKGVREGNPDPVHTSALDDVMAQAREDILINGKVPESVGKLDDAIENVRNLVREDTTETGLSAEKVGDMGSQKWETRTTSKPQIDMSELVRVKREVQTLAEWGQPATPVNRPYRLLYKSIAKFTKDSDKTGLLAKGDADFEAMADQVNRANDIVYNADNLDIAPGKSVDPGGSDTGAFSRAALERRAAAFFGRAGDDTQAGSLAAEQMDELANASPQYKRLMAMVRAKKAQEALRYGNSGANQANIETGMGRAAPGYLGMAGITPGNMGVASIRVGLPAAENIVIPGAPKVQAGASVGTSLYEAHRKKRDRQRRQRETLRGGED